MSNGNGGKSIFTIIKVVVLFGGIASAAFFMEDRYSKKVDAASKVDLAMTQKTAQRALMKSDYIQVDFIINTKQSRLWQLQDRHGCPPRPDCPRSVREEMRRLETELKDLRIKKQAMEKRLMEK